MDRKQEIVLEMKGICRHYPRRVKVRVTKSQLEALEKGGKNEVERALKELKLR